MGALGISNILDSNVSGSDISDFIINDMGLSNYTDSQGRTLGSFGVDAVAFESGRILLSNAFANFGKEFTEDYISSNNITINNGRSHTIGNLLNLNGKVYAISYYDSLSTSSYLNNVSFISKSDVPLFFSGMTYSDCYQLGYDSSKIQLNGLMVRNDTFNFIFFRLNGETWSYTVNSSPDYNFSFALDSSGNLFGVYSDSSNLFKYSSRMFYIGVTFPSSSVLESSLDPTYEDYQQAFDDAVRPDTEENEDKKTVAIPWAGDDLNTIDDFIDQILAGDITIDLAEEIAEPATTYSQETESTTLIDGQAPFNNYMPGGSFFDNLQSVFPFCLPFDFVTAINLLNADPVAPEFDFVLAGGGYFEDLETTISLEDFESVAGVFRTLMLILFIIGLIFATRKLIMWWPSG